MGIGIRCTRVTRTGRIGYGGLLLCPDHHRHDHHHHGGLLLCSHCDDHHRPMMIIPEAHSQMRQIGYGVCHASYPLSSSLTYLNANQMGSTHKPKSGIDIYLEKHNFGCYLAFPKITLSSSQDESRSFTILQYCSMILHKTTSQSSE